VTEPGRNGGRALVAGWFSFEQMGATAGDVLARDLACEWLEEASLFYDVAVAPPFEGGVDWRRANPADYSHVVFVCGPFGNGWPVTDFLERYRACRLVGVNLSMLEPLEVWNPFELLLERDSDRTARPDVSFLSERPRVPVVGLVLIDPQPEYGQEGVAKQANARLERLAASRDLAVVRIDTRLDENRTGLRSVGQVESLVARMDAVLTTRLHGTVLALKHGVPTLAIDPVKGGAKISRQAETVRWPLVFTVDASEQELERALDYCLTAHARQRANECAARARDRLADVRSTFISELARE
jgi:hypothetical protein